MGTVSLALNPKDSHFCSTPTIGLSANNIEILVTRRRALHSGEASCEVGFVSGGAELFYRKAAGALVDAVVGGRLRMLWAMRRMVD